MATKRSGDALHSPALARFIVKYYWRLHKFSASLSRYPAVYFPCSAKLNDAAFEMHHSHRLVKFKWFFVLFIDVFFVVVIIGYLRCVYHIVFTFSTD